MTTLSLLGGDFEILFDDETVGGNAVAGMRMIRRASGASATVYTSRALYSDVADKADFFQAMGFRNPMLPVTPNAFTLENYYFMPRSSTEWLKEGTITANWSLNGADPDSNGNGVIAIAYTVGMGADFVAADIGRQVVGGTTGDTGTLLDFETAPDGTKYAWIRPDDSTPVSGDIFDNGSETLSVTADMGTGNVTAAAVGTSGNTRYTAIQAIGSVPTSTEVYVYQNRLKLTDSTGGFQWWTTDATVSLGIISVLIRTHFQAAGTADTDGIADSDLEVFARRYSSLYDNFRLNVGAGGFSALPLASAADINNTTGYSTFTGSGGMGTFTVGEEATEAVSGATIVITAVGGTVMAPVLEYYLVGDLTDIFSSGAQTVTGADSGATCTSAAPTANTGGPTDSASGEGGTVTITLGHVTSDHDGDGTVEPYSVDINAQTNVPIAKVYERMKYVTRRGATATDLFGAGVNVPGESYRGAQQLVWYDNPSMTDIVQGDDLTGQGGYTARVMSNNATAAGAGASQDYLMITDAQTSLDSIADNDQLSDEAMNTADADTAGAGGAFINHASVKASPFGSFTGSQIFGAPGILFTGIDLNPQDYILTDDIGTLNTPPNTVTFTVSNTAAGDRVFVARDDGVTAGVINKNQFGGMTVTAQSATSVTVGGSVDPEVPQSAWIRVVAIDEQQEHKYAYSSRTTGASGVFTFTSIASSPGSHTAATSTTAITDSTGDFVNDGVLIGMLVRNTTMGKTTHVWEITSVAATVLGVRALYGPLDATQDWDMGDTFEINETIQAYDTNDRLYDLIIDNEATTTTISNTFIQSTTFNVVVNVRQGKVILPFTQNPQVNASGGSSTVVRQPDTIAV